MLKFVSRRDFIAAVVLLSTGASYGLATLSLPNRSLPNTPGPAFLPWLISAGLIILSAALLVRALTDDGGEPLRASPDRLSTLRPLALISFVVYLAVLPYAGFLVASVPFFAGLMWLYGERNRIVLSLAALIVPVSLFYIFRQGFQILLPVGIW